MRALASLLSVALRTHPHPQCRSVVHFDVLVELTLPLIVGDLGCS
jgi:hypothetical protein